MSTKLVQRGPRRCPVVHGYSFVPLAQRHHGIHRWPHVVR
jgi:hypothetical protein